MEFNPKELDSDKVTLKMIFDRLKKYCQDKELPCVIYMDGLDGATDDTIDDLMNEMRNLKKDEPIYIFGSFKGYPMGNYGRFWIMINTIKRLACDLR